MSFKKIVKQQAQEAKPVLRDLGKVLLFIVFIYCLSSVIFGPKQYHANHGIIKQTPAIASGVQDQEIVEFGFNLEVLAKEEESNLPNLNQEAKNQLAERINLFTKEYGGPLVDQDLGSAWVEAGIKYNRHPYVLVAIAVADTSLGKNLSTPYNLGNVGNTDSCPNCQAFSSWEQGIESIAQTVANENLREAYRVCHLSVGGWSEPDDNCQSGKYRNKGRFYASSGVNWNRNVNYTYSFLLGTKYNITHSIIFSHHFNLS